MTNINTILIRLLLLMTVAIAYSAQNKTGFVYDERCLLHQHVPEVPERVIKIREKLVNNELLDKLILTTPLSDVTPYIRLIHTDAHITSILRIPNTGTSALAAVEGLLGAVKAVSDGTVLNAFCALRPPGHHANNSGSEEGFCFFSNVAIAARYAQALGHKRILIIDWDYHHGNATQNAFYTDSTVLFFSTHNRYAYPSTGDPSLTGSGPGLGFNINVHLNCGATDADMLDAWQTKLIPKVDSFKPDFILISAGFDSREDDALGCFNITDSGYIEMTKIVMKMADTYCNGRVVSVLEGGYNVDGVASAASAHVSTLLGLQTAVEKNAVKQKGQMPYLRQGFLSIPKSDMQITSVILFNAMGKKIYNLDISSKERISVVKEPLSHGQYFIRIEFNNAKPLVLPFSYVD